MPERHPSLQRLDRSVEAELAYTLSRLRVLERLPDNPVGVDHRKAGASGVALMARYLPVPSFNTVLGLNQGDEGDLEEVVAWYRAAGVPGRFEAVPGRFSPELGRELARLGYVQSGFHASLIAEPLRSTPSPAAGVTVEEVRDADTFDTFIAAYAAGWGIPDPAGFRANVGGWLGEPGWTLYLGRFDGRPAATAILNVREGVAYLADGSTDPTFRGRGLHGALIARRLVDAGTKGADFACSGAEFLSGSHRNMIRAGMTLQFVRAIWTVS